MKTIKLMSFLLQLSLLLHCTSIFATYIPLVGEEYEGGHVVKILAPEDNGYVEGQVKGVVCFTEDLGSGTWDEAVKLVSDFNARAYYQDWHLPSADELKWIDAALNKTAKTKFEGTFYWGEANYGNNGWTHNFTNGANSYYNKNGHYKGTTRPVRTFIIESSPQMITVSPSPWTYGYVTAPDKTHKSFEKTVNKKTELNHMVGFYNSVGNELILNKGPQTFQDAYVKIPANTINVQPNENLYNGGTYMVYTPVERANYQIKFTANLLSDEAEIYIMNAQGRMLLSQNLNRQNPNALYQSFEQGVPLEKGEELFFYVYSSQKSQYVNVTVSVEKMPYR